MSKRENIANNLITVIDAISSPDIIKATRQPFDIDELSDKQYPAVILQTSEESRQDIELGSGAQTRQAELDFVLMGFVKGAESNLDTKRNDIDFHIPMGSLCRHFHSSIKYESKIRPHLVPDPTRVNFWKKQLNTLGKGPYIGICWKSLKTSANRLQNNSNILQWKSILKIPDVKFINLQPKSFEDDIKRIYNEIGVTVHNFDDIDHFNDLYDVSALISALDMVISTKTTVPLIAAGVGTKTKLANWRQSSWNNVLFNPISTFVDFYERNSFEPWEKVFDSILEDILKDKKLGVLSE